MNLDLSNLMPDKQAIRDINQLVFLDMMEPGKLDLLLDIVTGVRNGSRYGEIGEPGELIEAAQGCNPTYNKSMIPTYETVWNISEFGLYEELCADEVIGTIMKYSRDNGIDANDITADEFQTKILVPLLEKAIAKDIWRSAFFNDVNATVYSGNNTSGQLEDSKNAKKWNWCDGIFKRLNAAVADGQIAHVNIAANEEATYKLQKSAFYMTQGAATDVLDEMIIEASGLLRGAEDQRIICTQSFADALKLDMRRKYNIDLAWESVFAGLQVTKYDGIEFIAVPMWDEIIRTCFVNPSHHKTAWLNPHRAIYCTKRSLKLATENNGGNKDVQGNALPGNFAQLKIWFNEDSEVTRFKVKDTMGTGLYDPRQIVYAY